MNILVTIAARGGSKGVPNKNIRMLCGKPLIAHTILQAKAWGRATRIVVSTDAPAIAAVAKEYGADVPTLRPAELATDTAGKLAVIRHAWQHAETHYQLRFDLIVDLDVTAPLRTVQDLEHCYQRFVECQPTTLFSVVPAHKNPYFNMVELSADGVPSLVKSGGDVTRRQDAPAVYDMNASIYFYQRAFLAEARQESVMTANSQVHIMPDISGFDIDREIDFVFVEFLVEQGHCTL